MIKRSKVTPIRALLLGGGLGTRLRPLTDHVPKCLVRINGKPLLEIWLDLLLQERRVERILINTHHLAEKVDEFCELSSWKDFVDIQLEIDLLGTAGTVRRNRDFFNHRTIMIAHADNLTKFNFSDFVGTFLRRPNHCIGTMMTFVCDNPSSCGIVTTDSDGIVQSYFEKVKHPPGNIANAAVFLFDQRLYSEPFISNSDIDFCGDTVPRLVGRVNTFMNDTYHRDIGTMRSYEAAQEDFKE